MTGRMQDELFKAIRAACPPAVWSRGVELARQDAVTGDHEDAAEIRLRVQNPDTGLSPVVTLYPEDEDWQCTCNGPDDPCAHVAAAAIALRRAAEQGQGLPRSRASGGKLVYRLVRRGDGLELERLVQHDGGETRLDVALTAVTTGRVKGPPLSATSDDMEIDLALEGARTGVLPAKIWPKLCPALARIDGVTLDGRAIKVAVEPVGIRAVVRDEGPGIDVRGEQDPAIVETFANGAALCKGDVLRRVALPALAPRELEILRKGRFFGPKEWGELAGEIMPRLWEQVPVDLRTQRLPGKAHARARLELETEPARDALAVTPWIVYGDPPLARVRFGRLEALGDSVPTRDLDAERLLRDQLGRDLGLELEKRVVMPAADALALVQRLERLGLARAVSGRGAEAFTRRAPIVPRFEVDADGAFRLAFDATDAGADGGAGLGERRGDGKGAVDPERVLAAWRAGESLVPLLDGGYAPLPRDWLARYGDKIEALLAARAAEGGRLPRAAGPQLADLCDELGLEPPLALTKLRDRLADFTGIPAAPLPAALTAELRSYQRAGVDWLDCLRGLELGALLADDMGLGKTLQTLAAMRGRTLVVAPTSVVFNWVAEARRFRPDLRVALYHGPARALDAGADLTITTYALLRLDVDALAGVAWDMLVLDEAQAIKNADSQVARAARRLQGGFRLALTGTPVENRLDDLHSQMQFLNPGLLGTRRDFQERFARPIQAGDHAATELLRGRLKPFILRRLKREVARELPPRTDTVLHVELSPNERAYYDAILAATRSDVLERLEHGGSMLEALEALLRLRQACCHPDLLPGVEGQASSKLALLVETLQEASAEGHKSLVFSQWTSHLDLMEPALQAAGVPFLRLDGSTADRAAVVQAFQAESGPPVLLMSLKAGGVGLNLTAADHVFITDPWWNPAAEDQAADRAHRIGQDKPVLVSRLVALGTVEERILALQAKKRALAEAAIGTGGAAAAGLTKADLLSLLG
jgi:hypothetical protein